MGYETVSPETSRSTGLWREHRPLILASKSLGRRQILEQAAIPLVVHPAEIDERALESQIRSQGGGADTVASRLANEKALAVSRAWGDHFVIGADQLASCDGHILGKPADKNSAYRQLQFLSGKTHRLHSAVAIARNEKVIFADVFHADLKLRRLSDEFIDIYLSAVGDKAFDSVGAYQIEGLGVHLFETIEGDNSTIIGLPVLATLAALRLAGAALS